MSPNETSQRLRATAKPASNTAKDNAPLPLRPLAPKTTSHFRPVAIRSSSDSPFSSSQAKQSSQDRGQRDNRCAACFRRNCSLVSHKFRHEPSIVQPHPAPSIVRASSNQDAFTTSYAIKIAALYDDSSPELADLSILEQLPVPSELNRSQMERLFHDWFLVEAPRHFTVPRPAQIKSDLLHSPFLAPAFADPVLCLSILTVSAAAHGQQLSNSNNVLALTLCDGAMRKLRERVNADRDTVTDTTIAAAIYLWAASLYLTDDQSLQQHASSVQALMDVRRNGQKSGLSEAVADLFMWVDITNTLRLNSASQFPEDHQLDVPKAISPQSGKAWLPGELQQIPISDQTVLGMCHQSCQAIDLLDQTPPEEMEALTYKYLFDRVGQLYQESSKLRATYSGTGTLEECIILAIDILKLIVFNGGCTPSGRGILKLQARYLSKAIRAAGGGNLWRTQIHLFIWLVSLVFVSRPAGEHQKWSSLALKGGLEHIFGPRQDWSDDTFDQLRRLLFTFGWSYSSPLADVKTFCDELWS